jgi:calcium-binding protein CML
LAQSADLFTNGRLTFREFLVCLALGALLGMVPFTAAPAPVDAGGLRTAGESLRKMADAEVRESLIANDGRAILQTFHLCLEAFATFDRRHTGIITKSGLEAAMTILSTKGVAGSGSSSLHEREKHPIPTDALHFLSEERFKELDFDDDGNISFAEFLFAMFAWVGLDEDEEDEE